MYSCADRLPRCVRIFPGLRATTLLQILVVIELSGIFYDKNTMRIFDVQFSQLNIDHYAHLGGYMFGYGYAIFLQMIFVSSPNVLGGRRPWRRARPRFAGRGFRLDGMPVPAR